MADKITLITMGQGNVKALKKTLDSFSNHINEVVYGDLLIFDDDREVLLSYKKQYNINIQRLPFNYIFQMGFANCLNFLASNAMNDFVMYMNTSEVIDEDYGISDIVSSNSNCNAFFFTNRNEKHRWHRCYNKNEVYWSGHIHEETYGFEGDIKPYHKPIFMMKDEEKDMDNPFKVAVFNLVKCLTNFEQYRKIVDCPKLIQGTNEGWVKWAKEQTPSMQQRLNDYGAFYEAFKTGDYGMFLEEIYTNPFLETARFESSDLINFQGNRKIVL